MVARRLPPCFDLDDLKQAGYLGLIRAAELYAAAAHHDKAHFATAVPFAAYARHRIRGEILESARRRRYREATYQELGDWDAPVTDPMEENLSVAQLSAVVARAVGQLDERDQVAILHYYLREERLVDVGARLGVKTSRSCHLVHRAIQHAREQVARSGITPP